MTAAVTTAAAIFAAPQPASALSFAFLTLSPVSGPSTTSITARYQYVPLGRKAPGGGCGTAPVAFTWDGQQLPGQAEPVPEGGHCVATLTFTPPPGLDSPGWHTVAGEQGPETAQATFTVTGSATPAPVPPPPPPSPSAVPATGAPSASAQPSPSAARTASTGPSAFASPSTEPLPSEETSYAAGPDAAGGAAKPPGGGSTGTFLAVLLGVFTMLGGGTLLTLALRRRPDIDGPELPQDVTAAGA